MENLLDNLDFDEWLIYAFDHPADHLLLQWYYDIDADFWDELKNPSVTVEYMTRLFNDASTHLAPYSDAQINQGLWFIVSNGGSSHMFAVEKVTQAEQVKFWEAVYQCYANFFAEKCSAHLSHLDEKDMNPINSICYMWWDIIPISPYTCGKKLTTLCQGALDVMRRALTIPHDACRESALHGLGHWSMDFPNEVKAIIDDFLKANPDLRLELRQYAVNARAGCVL